MRRMRSVWSVSTCSSEEAWACGRQAPFPCRAASARAAPAMYQQYQHLAYASHMLRIRYACPSRAASARAAPALAAGMSPPHTLRIRYAYATHTLPHTLRIRYLRLLQALLPVVHEPRLPPRVHARHSLLHSPPQVSVRIRYAYASYATHMLRIRQTFASALTASGVSI